MYDPEKRPDNWRRRRKCAYNTFITLSTLRTYAYMYMYKYGTQKRDLINGDAVEGIVNTPSVLYIYIYMYIYIYKCIYKYIYICTNKYGTQKETR